LCAWAIFRAIFSFLMMETSLGIGALFRLMKLLPPCSRVHMPDARSFLMGRCASSWVRLNSWLHLWPLLRQSLVPCHV
jgi:hypothetical protein